MPPQIPTFSGFDPKRLERGTPKHRGTLLPMAMAELPLVEICIQMGNVCQPVNVGEALILANDLIKKTEHQDAVAELKKIDIWEIWILNTTLLPRTDGWGFCGAMVIS